MTTGTHMIVGAVAYAVGASFRGWPLGARELAAVLFGSVLPDADLPSSAMGRALGPVSRWLYRLVGHRTATHSGLALLALCVIGFLLGWDELWRAFLVGYGSHVLADSLNVQGVRFLWPGRVIFRFFRNPRYHFAVGRRGEYIFLAIVVVSSALYWPVAREGFRRMMHRAMKDIDSAVMDYHEVGERRETFLRVIEGTELETGLPVSGRFRVVASISPNELLVEADEERLWVVGEGQEIHVYPRKCVLEVGRFQRVEVGEFDLAGRTLWDLREHLLGRRAYVTGTVEFAGAVAPTLPHRDRYESVVVAGTQAHLRHARWSDLRPYARELIVRGRVRVKWVTVIGEEHASRDGARSGPPRGGEARGEEELTWERERGGRIVRVEAEGVRVVVREGEWVVEGQVLAVRPDKERELEDLDAAARWRRARFREQMLAIDAEQQQLRAGALDVSEEGSVEGARWRWEQAEAEYERKRKLREEGIVSDQDLERARATAEARRARYEELRAVRERRLRGLAARRAELEIAERAQEDEYRRKRERLLRERDVISPVSGEVIKVEYSDKKARVLIREAVRRAGGSGRGAARERVVRVVDGDTLEVEIGGRRERVRLIGVDAPEMGQGEWGKRAREALERRVRAGEVRLELDVQERDRYGRVLAYLWVDGRLVNEELVREGLAVVFTVPPNVRYVERLRAAQQEARQARRGVWGPDGLRESPGEYRKRRRGA